MSPQLGLLKSTLLQLDSTFSERTYGAGSFRDFAQKLAAAGHVTLRESGRNVLVEQVEGGSLTAEEAPRHEHHGRRRQDPRREEQQGARPETAQGEAPQDAPQDEAPAAGQEPRMAEGIREVRRLFQAAQNPPRWPMYIRQAKQFLRNVEASFDERKFGFASLVDLLRACQREGLFRIERDRQGVMRLFPGNIMQPTAGAEDDDNRGNAIGDQPSEPHPLPAEPEWAPRAESPADVEVVEGAVVQEMEAVPPVVDGETPPPAEAGVPRQGRRRGQRSKAATEGVDGQPAAPRSRARKQPAEGTAPRARKTARPRVTRTRKKEDA